MLNKNKFIELMTMLAEMFNSKITELKFRMYYDSLKEYPDEKVEMAIRKLIKTHKYSTMPMPAHIIECIKNVSYDATLNYKNIETDNQLKLIVKQTRGIKLTGEEIAELKRKAGLI